MLEIKTEIRHSYGKEYEVYREELIKHLEGGSENKITYLGSVIVINSEPDNLYFQHTNEQSYLSLSEIQQLAAFMSNAQNLTTT